MVSEKCAPYDAQTKGHSCSSYENCAPKAKIMNTHFVGGGYAEVSEQQMMQDILRNGPVSIEFQANKYFSAYQSGIISEKGVKDVKWKLEQLAELPKTQAELDAQDVNVDDLYEKMKADEQEKKEAANLV